MQATPQPDTYVLTFDQIEPTQVAVVGGKGAQLAALSRIEGVRVPPGFCVTTEAFRRAMAAVPQIDDLLDRLSRVTAGDRDLIASLSATIRTAVEAAVVPDEVAVMITHAVTQLGEQVACAVRSSATAEDSPTASFAGQQDTYLDVVGQAEIVRHVSRCWASLFTERAVAYRIRNGFDHRAMQMAVVVQRMVAASAAGVMFTADPVTSNRTVVSIEAICGLGDALVSGLVNPDLYTVRGGQIVSTTVAAEHGSVQVSLSAGTHDAGTEAPRRDRPVLTDGQIVELAQLGRLIEVHAGCPQDIEWCLDSDGFQIVQSRPITTLFPVPVTDDDEPHVYVSVGHQQMMTDPMKPLGLSVWQLTALRPMTDAGGRLFVDVTQILASPSSREGIVEMLGRSDPLIGDALRTVIDRGDFLPSVPDAGPSPYAAPTADLIEADPAVVAGLIEATRASIEAARSEIRTKEGEDLLDFILADIEELRRNLSNPQTMQVIVAGMEATFWLNDRLHAWLGEKNAADALAQSAPGNVTSEMGLALLDLADAIRPHQQVVAFLGVVDGDGFLDELPTLPGGTESRDAIRAYLDTYGMRCVGEIDITRPRWSERPSTLIPAILGNIKNFAPGAGTRRFEQGRLQALTKELDLLQRVRALPDGEAKAAETKQMIDRVRTFIGYREYPKYGMVTRYFIYKQALLEEAERLVQAGVLRGVEDMFFLRFHELHGAVRTQHADHQLIDRRKQAFRSFHRLTPPRVLTSDGEAVAGAYRRDDLPPGALAGLPVSAGTIEGRARVIRDIASADLEPGDILVTAFTDPSWSPLFVAISGLVTEVGGVMTHGAVIAREYGLPAVVGVQGATRLIRDGQRIRVDGTHGYIEILPETAD